jgi:RNA polymerase sigma factor for flagellar operon FliA
VQVSSHAATVVAVADRVAEPGVEPPDHRLHPVRAVPAAGPEDVPPPRDTPADAVSELWDAYARRRDRAARDRLVEHYVPLVRGVASRMASGLPASIDVADLVQSGIFGLLDALRRYEPSRCTRFESYAAQRIRGAMLDELRAQDWVPRTVRGRVREVDRARERLEGRLGRSPSSREVAAELGVSLRELRRISQHRRLVSVEALEEDVGSGAVGDMLADDVVADPMAVVQLRETWSRLTTAVHQLGERDQLVVRLYYLENRTLAEIGRLLGVTESRVCQLHARLVVRLRGRMEQLEAG